MSGFLIYRAITIFYNGQGLEMMKYIFTVMVGISLVFGLAAGNISEVSNAALSECSQAVELMLKLIGPMAFWGGMMRVADKAGITDFIAKLFRAPLKFLFKGIDANGKAFKAVTMNITANLLGLGNAATPLGIQAVKELSEEESAGGVATDNIIMLVVLNTASIQLIPTTVAAMRLAHGSSSPLDVMPAILISSAASVAAGIASVKCFAAGRNVLSRSKRTITDESH